MDVLKLGLYVLMAQLIVDEGYPVVFLANHCGIHPDTVCMTFQDEHTVFTLDLFVHSNFLIVYSF